MLKKRLIPCLFLKNGFLVRSERFTNHQYLGNALHQVERFNAWAVDELIYIDITTDDSYDVGRDDLKIKSEDGALGILEVVAKGCFMPLTFGGRINTVQDISDRVKRGADKVTINSQALRNPDFISESARIFGSQCIIVSIDVATNANGEYEVMSSGGKLPTGKRPIDWAKEAEKLGAGEIFLNSVDRDGTGKGYDLTLTREVADALSIPVIACGGVGNFEDFGLAIRDGHADAAAAGNIFHFTELSAKKARKTLIKMGIDVRN